MIYDHFITDEGWTMIQFVGREPTAADQYRFWYKVEQTGRDEYRMRLMPEQTMRVILDD